MRLSKACVVPDGCMMHADDLCVARLAVMCMHVLSVHAHVSD